MIEQTVLPFKLAATEERRRGGGRGLKGLEQVNRAVVQRQLRAEARREYTLDMDATVIEAEKESAKWSYKGVKGYTPLVGHLAENGLVVGDEFREGNESPGSGMERMSGGQLEANAMFFRIGVLSYNLSRVFELQALPEGWARYQLRTLRWKLFLVAGKVVRHGGQVWLKVRGYLMELFEGIRRRSFAFSLG